MWPKFGNSSISMSEVMTTHFYKDLTRKTAFLRDGLGSSSIIRDWRSVQTWNFTPVWEKGQKVSKFWGLIPKFVEVTGKKLVEAPPPFILNKLKLLYGRKQFLVSYFINFFISLETPIFWLGSFLIFSQKLIGRGSGEGVAIKTLCCAFSKLSILDSILVKLILSLPLNIDFQFKSFMAK